jgi:hypothetical protein
LRMGKKQGGKKAESPQGRKAARPQGRKGWHDFCCGALPESTVQRA